MRWKMATFRLESAKISKKKKHQKFHFHSHPRHPIVRIKYSSEFGSNEQAHSSSSINHLSLCYFFLFSFLFHKNDEPRISSVACFRCVTIHYVRFNPRKKTRAKFWFPRQLRSPFIHFFFALRLPFFPYNFPSASFLPVGSFQTAPSKWIWIAISIIIKL